MVEKKDFSLSANFNVSFNKNKVDKLASGETEWKQKAALSNWSGTYDYKLVVGQTMGLIYGYQTDGFYTVDDFEFTAPGTWTLKPGIADNSSFSSGGFPFKPGGIKFKKLSPVDESLPEVDQYRITEEDLTVIGNTNPKMIGGFGLSATWKGFDFTSFFNFMYGFDVFNVNKFKISSVQSHNYNNFLSNFDMAHRFRYLDDQGVNLVRNPEALAALNENASIYSPQSLTQGITMDYLIEDGSFLRLSTLTLGYTIPGKYMNKIGVRSLRVYASGYNLYTWTKYTGYDPEVNVQNGLTPGLDNNVYPRSRTLTFGINLNF
ncbi:MAG: SusC/RagA family TonB-linked outer membrane protein, partial [Tannerella sp.]|jgi:hypothetical protein|nr:SusC/RagA family TonB-linked outer membrane protein [Tannerella sp.]